MKLLAPLYVPMRIPWVPCKSCESDAWVLDKIWATSVADPSPRTCVQWRCEVCGTQIDLYDPAPTRKAGNP